MTQGMLANKTTNSFLNASESSSQALNQPRDSNPYTLPNYSMGAGMQSHLMHQHHQAMA